MASLSVRISLDPAGRIGPGKIDLLEAIAAQGSISAAGRQMAMSYRRAWELVEAMNTMFVQPVVERQVGGKNGGGASLTPFGETLVRRYRAIERAAADVAVTHLAALQDEAVRPNKTDQTGTNSTSLDVTSAQLTPSVPRSLDKSSASAVIGLFSAILSASVRAS